MAAVVASVARTTTTSAKAALGTSTSAMTGDVLFDCVAAQHAARGGSWGNVLDAGTGSHSLKWLLERKDVASVTAVTADKGMAATCASLAARYTKAGAPDESRAEIVIGNWDDEDLLEGRTYDIILADYLVGAMDGFSPCVKEGAAADAAALFPFLLHAPTYHSYSPTHLNPLRYTQDLIFGRLKKHLSPSGALYVVGLQPVPDYGKGDGAKLIGEVRRLRDACILLAGHRMYREYPPSWIERSLKQHGYDVGGSKSFPILYSYESINRQISVAERKLPLIKDEALREKLQAHVDDLRTRVKAAVDEEPTKRVRLGADYVIGAWNGEAGTGEES